MSLHRKTLLNHEILFPQILGVFVNVFLLYQSTYNTYYEVIVKGYHFSFLSVLLALVIACIWFEATVITVRIYAKTVYFIALSLSILKLLWLIKIENLFSGNLFAHCCFDKAGRDHSYLCGTHSRPGLVRGKQGSRDYSRKAASLQYALHK